MSAPALYLRWLRSVDGELLHRDAHQLPDSHLIQQTRVSKLFYMINWNKTFHFKNNFLIIYVAERNAVDIHQTCLWVSGWDWSCVLFTSKATKISLRRLRCTLHLVWDNEKHSANSPPTWHQNCTAAAHLYQPTLCCLAQPSSAQPGSQK